MDKNTISAEIKKAKSTLQIERIIVRAYENEGYVTSNADFEKFKKSLGSEITTYISKAYGEEKGVIEILEDHYIK